MRASVLLLCLAVAGCKPSVSEPDARVVALPTAGEFSTPKSDERFANRYLLIAAAKETADEARAAAPADAAIFESTPFTGLRPCFWVAVVGTYEAKEDALEAMKVKAAKGVEALPRYSGKYVPKDSERREQCERKAAEAQAANSPRYLVQGDLLELHGEVPQDDAKGIKADPSGEVRAGDVFSLYSPDGEPLQKKCTVKGFCAEWNDSNDMGSGHCGERVALAKLSCATDTLGAFALPAKAKPPRAWSHGSDDAALERLVESGSVKHAKAELQLKATDDEQYSEETDSHEWSSPKGRVTFTLWKGKTGDGGCGRGETSTMSELLWWPKGSKAPDVLLEVGEREQELLGVTQLGDNDDFELTWSTESRVWMESRGGMMRYDEAHPFCGCGC